MIKLIAILLLIFSLGCSHVQLPDSSSYQTLGIAEVKHCAEYAGRDDGMIRECMEIKTSGFSGWEAIMNGAADAVVKILTLGLL